MLKFSKKLIQRPNLVRINFNSFSDKFKEKETAEEAYFVHKNDREGLKKLLQKLKTEQDKNHLQNEVNDLQKIFANHKIIPSEALIKEIQKWKENH